ncbi:hypothetical protein KJ359_000691 [Pestalotiopsis sp. 9143b]|nr:hypothetical protein KJ359_000691 [Pestalotiopsis sp. 9143b]
MSLKSASASAVLALQDAGLGDTICHADSDLYRERIADYWTLSAQKRPHCLVHPRSTGDVVKILKAILSVSDCHFAIRSGGHIAWGASNIDDGICIDLGVSLKSVEIKKDEGIVSIQPGARWREVYGAIAPHGIAVAGGRTAGVGAGGLLTGGGISWYIPRVGFCCDQLVNAEVVLADGSIINANAKEHADLWRSLKGASAGNFGVVTRLDVRILPYDGLWAGMLVSEASPERTADHVAAIRDLVDGSEASPDSSYIVLWHHEPTVFKDIVITSFAANTKGIENPPELKSLLEIPAIVRDMKQTNLLDFAVAMEQPYGLYNFWHTITVVNDERIMKKAVESHASAVARIKAVSKTGHFSSLCLFQALPSYYGRLGDERGGNVMGVNQHLKGRNAVSMLLSINVSEEEIREFGYQVAQEYLKEVEDFAKSVDGYIDWTYINYADKAQDPLGSLLDPAAIKAVALKYDPTGVFQKKTPGGFKISDVQT